MVNVGFVARGGVLIAVALAALACGKSDSKGSGGGGGGGKKSQPAIDASVAGPPIELSIVYGSEKKTWLEEQIKSFNASGARTAQGRPVRVTGKSMGSGEAMTAILTGAEKAHVFSPASGAYVTLLNQAWMSRDNHTRALATPGEPLVLSPIVIAMWKPMAEALGWPAKPIGWADILKVSRSPKGWGALGRPEWGAFKLGHTHPEYSNSGLLTALAVAYAGADKTRGLTSADLDNKATREFMTQVEDSVVHYGKSTGLFADKMLERGPSYLSAAVLYENLVIEAYGRPTAPELPVVAIYPVEGTFWSDHPYCVLDADWVGPAERDAAALFYAYLREKPRQQRALALGFRPADPAIAIGAPVDAAHGVDPLQPQTLLEVPDAATLESLLALWRATKKTSDVVLVFDKSGSMQGQPLVEAKAGAKAFLEALDPRDRVSLVFFDSQPYPPIGPVELSKGRADLEARIDGVSADGGTALYDTVAFAHEELTARAKKSPHRIHAIVVMTDGIDDGSTTPLSTILATIDAEGDGITVFTIAYGAQPDVTVLQQIAEASNATFSKGDVGTIIQVFRDIASFF